MSAELLHYPTTPLQSDPRRVIQVKILNALNNAGGAGTGTGTFAGVGSPEGVVAAAAGSTYYDTASGDFWVKETGAAGTTTLWVLLVS